MPLDFVNISAFQVFSMSAINDAERAVTSPNRFKPGSKRRSSLNKRLRRGFSHHRDKESSVCNKYGIRIKYLEFLFIYLFIFQNEVLFRALFRIIIFLWLYKHGISSLVSVSP